MGSGLKKRLLVLVLLCLAAGGRPGQAELLPPALEPPGTGGVEAVDRALAKLSGHRRVLVIAAHPDDEDTSLLAWVSRGLGGEAAYLSLSRGEGGQNLIGPELGVVLGLLRSQELLAARRIDGGRQSFTRAYDFGYTRSLEETFRFWPKEVLLEDAVRVLRRFRPQVVVSVFPEDGRGGHGQHQAAGVVAHEAYRLAGDPAAFPRLQAEGLGPWNPRALYRSTWFDREATTLTLPTGAIDPLTGRSLFQIAMASRSLHRSQDMGRILELGPRETRVGWVDGGGGRESRNLFAGIDTRLAAMAEGLPEGNLRRDLAGRLERAEALAREAREGLVPARLKEAVPVLASILGELRTARGLVMGSGVVGRDEVAAFLGEKIQAAEAGLAAAAGIAFDAVTEGEEVVPGEPFQVSVLIWNAGGEAVEVREVSLSTPEGWRVKGIQAGPSPLAPGVLGEWQFEVEAVPGTPFSLPYFLRRPLQEALYDWSDTPGDIQGEPFEPPPLAARVGLSLAGADLGLEREVVHRHRDQALGEIRRPLRVVPPVEVSVSPELLVWPVHQREPRTLDVTVVSNSRRARQGHLEVATPLDWPAVAPRSFHLSGPGVQETFRVEIRPPSGLTPGRYPIRVAAVLESGERVDLAIPVLDYPHIRPTPYPRPAVVEIQAADLRLPRLSRVAYLRGASDRVPEALEQVGIPLEVISAADLPQRDLTRYDAIVLGSRAYESDPGLAKVNGRLLDYVRRGGTLIVQYQQYPFFDRGFAPYPLEIARPHDRVTDEAAPVRLLEPGHPLLTTPNRIGQADWEGWVQERGLYLPRAWDGSYTPLLALADPGGPELQGSLLVAPLGRGYYVYTGLAFFRQLPAGVPGAYRLFANLLALGEGRP